METDLYDVIIIGAGQAGLAMGYELQKAGVHFIILDGGAEIGQSWQKRYDSLKLFTPSRYNGLAGLAFPGAKDRFPLKQEVVHYLQEYTRHFNLPVSLNQQVLEVSKPDHPEVYQVRTTSHLFTARQVVVCAGAFHQPKIPTFAQHISPKTQQLHSSQYKNPSQLTSGKVAVIGGGNSGVQIAEELVQANREVYFSFRGKLKSQGVSPLSMRLLFGSGLVHAGIDSWIGNMLYKRPEAIMGTNLEKLFAHPNITLTGGAIEVVLGKLVCEKQELTDVANIVWATGFSSDFSWIKLPVFNTTSQPLHHRGITPEKGLYFLGLPWLHSRSSGLLGGVSRDAAFLASKIMEQQHTLQLLTHNTASA